MSDHEPLFRPQAVAFRAARRDGRGGVLPLGARWLRWSFWLMLAALAACLAAPWIVRIDERKTAAAVVTTRGRAVSLLLPASMSRDLRRSRSLDITLTSGGPEISVHVVRTRDAEPAAVRRAGLPVPARPAVLVLGRLSSAASSQSNLPQLHPRDVDVTFLLRSERLVDVVARRLRTMMGSGGETA